MTENDKPKSEVRRRRRLDPEFFWLLVIFGLAIALRTVAVLTRQMVVGDEATFLRMAENLLAGKAPYEITGQSATHFSILYPLVTASFAVMTRNVVSAGYIVSVLFSSMMVLPAYVLGRVAWNPRVGKAAGALVAVLPVLIANGSLIGGQNLFAFWLFFAIFFGYRMQFTLRCLCGMFSGICMGLAYLENPTALYYVVTLFCLLVIVGFRQELGSYANKAALQFMLLFLVFAIPNVIFMTWMNGSFTFADRPTDKIYAAVHELPAGSLESEQQLMGLDESGNIKITAIEQGPGLFSSFVDSPWAFIKAVARTDYALYVNRIESLIPVWLLPLIGLALFRFAWTRGEALRFGFMILMLAPILVLPMVWGDTRILLPYVGLVMLWVGRGWNYLEDWLYGSAEKLAAWDPHDRRRKRQLQAALIVIMLAPLAALSIWNVARVDYPIEYKQAGEWLADNGGDGGKVMSREQSSSWYAKADLVPLPYASVEETIDYAKRQQAGFFVMSERVTEDLRPQLQPLMQTDNQYRDKLEPVYHSGEGTSSELIVYRVR